MLFEGMESVFTLQSDTGGNNVMERGSICVFMIYGNGKLHGSEIKHSVRRRLCLCACAGLQ